MVFIHTSVLFRCTNAINSTISQPSWIGSGLSPIFFISLVILIDLHFGFFTLPSVHGLLVALRLWNIQHNFRRSERLRCCLTDHSLKPWKSWELILTKPRGSDASDVLKTVASYRKSETREVLRNCGIVKIETVSDLRASEGTRKMKHKWYRCVWVRSGTRWNNLESEIGGSSRSAASMRRIWVPHREKWRNSCKLWVACTRIALCQAPQDQPPDRSRESQTLELN